MSHYYIENSYFGLSRSHDQKTLIIHNGNGISCTAFSPRIVGYAIYDNEFSGVLCFQQAAPSISTLGLTVRDPEGVKTAVSLRVTAKPEEE